MTQIKLIIYGAVVLMILSIGGCIYWNGRSDANTKTDLRVARETIKVERATQKIEYAIDMRVNAEGIQTATKAQEAAREIESIRTQRPAAVDSPRTDATVGAVPDAASARVMQLAREARAAAQQSSAKLQPARTGDR